MARSNNRFNRSTHKRLHEIYTGMKKRCYNPNCERYSDYGGRGISVCEEWRTLDGGFDRFVEWAESNGYSPELTIDRINNDGNYEPDNCKWSTYKEQARNTRKNIFVEYNGETKPLSEWCEILNLRYDSIHNRITSGWPPKMAFEKPLQTETKSFAQICREHGINPNTARDRMIKFGWDYESALNTPSRGRGTNHVAEREPEQVCPICSNKFTRKIKVQKYCSKTCCDIAAYERVKARKKVTPKNEQANIQPKEVWHIRQAVQGVMRIL